MKPLAVVPTYVRDLDELEVLVRCVQSMKRTADVEPLVVDDGSPNAGVVAELERVMSRLETEVVRQPENAGFAATVNVGLRRALAEGRDAILVNADVEFPDGVLGLTWAESMALGDTEVVGARLLYPNGLIQHAGTLYSLLHRSWDHRFKYAPGDLREACEPHDCPVTAALQFIRHRVLATVGVYDETFRMGFEDVDYCLRVYEAGGTCLYNPAVVALHHESMFRGKKNDKIRQWEAESWKRWVEKHGATSMARWVPPIV